MAVYPNSVGSRVLRLIAGLLLLGCPRIGSAAGTWSVISLPQQPGEVVSPRALAVDAAGDLYVAERAGPDYLSGRIQKRDAQGNWSVIATGGTGIGQVNDLTALAVDAAGILYVADLGPGNDGARIQRRDAQGHWSVIATGGEVQGAGGLALDAASNLYVADVDGRIQMRDAQGNWSVLASYGSGLGQVSFSDHAALAVDAAGNLYVGEDGRIQERDAQGRWSVIATWGRDLGQVVIVRALAVDTADNLYVAEQSFLFVGKTGIQKRDAQGNWSLIATAGDAPGQVDYPAGLAVDTAGNLYVADAGNNRVQMYSPSAGQ